jgi:hypothetical protein
VRAARMLVAGLKAAGELAAVVRARADLSTAHGGLAVNVIECRPALGRAGRDAGRAGPGPPDVSCCSPDMFCWCLASTRR